MNTTKIMSVFVLAMFAISFIVPMVLAQDTEAISVGEEVEVEDAGVTPNSMFYGIDNAMDRLRLALTFNKAKRAELALRISEERLAEVKEMMEQNKAEKAEKAQEKHEEFLERAKKAFEEIETNGDEAKNKDALSKMARIQNRIEAHQEKVSEVKARILERQADKMTEEQLTHLEEVFGKIEAKAQEMGNKALEKRENVKTKYKVLAEKTDEEVEEVLEEIDSAEGLIQAREKRLERTEERAERFIAVDEARLERVRTQLSASGLTDEQKAKIQTALGKLDEKLNASQERTAERIELAKEKLEQAKSGLSDDVDESEDESTGTSNKQSQ